MANSKNITDNNKGIKLTITDSDATTENSGYIAQYSWSSDNPNDLSSENYFGKLFNCMEIDWGNAQPINIDNIDINNIISNGTLRIKTSADLLQLIFWICKKIKERNGN